MARYHSDIPALYEMKDLRVAREALQDAGTVGYACAGTGELADLTGLTIKLALCVQQYTYGGKWKNVHCRHETIILSLEPGGDLTITPFVCTSGDTYRTYGHFSGEGDLVWEKENGEDYSEELSCV
jgi:hypothetical protein